MTTENGKKAFGTYHSQLKDYITRQNNYDNTPLVFTDKFGPPAFTVTRPRTTYRNCRLISGYPHFDIPTNICINEIYNFINGQDLYSKNFCIRFGDTHPDKPIPKLGQMRNVILGDIWSALIPSSGQVLSIYPLGDISEKSICHYVHATNSDAPESVIEELVRTVMSPSDGHPLYSAYKKHNLAIIKNTLYPFLKEFSISPTILIESELYQDKQLFHRVTNQIVFEGGLKNNGNPKYVLQELMFLLNKRFDGYRIISILGENQSDHVSKVLKLLKDNHLDCDAAFLKYGWCENGLSADRAEWGKALQTFAHSALPGLPLDERDLLRLIICALPNTTKIDFSALTTTVKYIHMFQQIINSFVLAQNVQEPVNTDLKNTLLLGKMALVFQELDISIVSGEQGRFFTYLAALSQEYMTNHKGDPSISRLYARFMQRALKLLTLDKTTLFQAAVLK